MHKIFTQGMPLDLELLTLGVAYLAANNNIFLAFVAACLGPLFAEAARGHVCSGSFFKPFVLFIVIGVASIFGPTTKGIFFALVIGAIANYIRVAITGHTDPISSFIARSTHLGFSSYLLFFVLVQFL